VRRALAAVAALVVAAQGCAVGGGWGLVEGCIHLPGCSLDPGGGPFDACAVEDQDFRFRPDFFAADLSEDGSMTIRVQRGGYRIGESDGFVFSVPDHGWVAEHLVADPDDVEESEMLAVPPLDDLGHLALERRFKASAFVGGSCPGSGVSFAEGVGRIWFLSMYQNVEAGDPRNEPTIHFGFDIEFVDPWPYEEPQPDSPRLVARGEVRFDYQRGSPAQPYP
jgi:hypothetical protein